jgi:murein DD-endopeptidase MepM/ murein hydrolase activator NlpD
MKFLIPHGSKIGCFFVSLLLTIFLGACQPSGDNFITAQTEEIIDNSSPLKRNLYQQPAQMDPLFTKNGNDSDILEFTFPQPGPIPASFWRPPLYKAPFALGPFDHFYFQRPIAADEVNWPLADYRYGGVFWADIVHTGIDIVAKRGTPVLAAGSGEVISAGYGIFYGNEDPLDPYGLSVTIRHDFGYKGKRLYTIYGHMDRVDAIVGQKVQTGDELGIVGMTGKTTGPHLHFEVRIGDNSIYTTRNPELWIAPPQGWGVLVGQLRTINGTPIVGQRVDVFLSGSDRSWYVISYGGESVLHNDEYFQENLVLGDLPEGAYTISLNYGEDTFNQDVRINPGTITFFTFHGENGFNNNPPPISPPFAWMKPVN